MSARCTPPSVRGIPHLAKNERDMGHPALDDDSKSNGGLDPESAHVTDVIGSVHLDLKSVWIKELERFLRLGVRKL